jgi:hypothetical protein
MDEAQEFLLILLTPRIAMFAVFVSLPNVRLDAMGKISLQFLTSSSEECEKCLLTNCGGNANENEK